MYLVFQLVIVSDQLGLVSDKLGLVSDELERCLLVAVLDLT